MVDGVPWWEGLAQRLAREPTDEERRAATLLADLDRTLQRANLRANSDQLKTQFASLMPFRANGVLATTVALHTWPGLDYTAPAAPYFERWFPQLRGRADCGCLLELLVHVLCSEETASPADSGAAGHNRLALALTVLRPKLASQELRVTLNPEKLRAVHASTAVTDARYITLHLHLMKSEYSAESGVGARSLRVQCIAAELLRHAGQPIADWKETLRELMTEQRRRRLFIEDRLRVCQALQDQLRKKRRLARRSSIRRAREYAADACEILRLAGTAVESVGTIKHGARLAESLRDRLDAAAAGASDDDELDTLDATVFAPITRKLTHLVHGLRKAAVTVADSGQAEASALEALPSGAQRGGEGTCSHAIGVLR